MAVVPSACRDSKEAQAEAPPQIEVKASVVPFEGVVVSSPIEGTIAEVRVTEGAAVKTGDVIATLTNPAVERDLAYARAAVLAAEHRLRSVRAPRAVSRPASNKDRESAAMAVVRQKQARVERMRGLLASGDVARQDVENAEAELALAQRELDAVRQVPDPVAAPATDTAVMQAELERAQAEQTFAQHRKSQLVITSPAAGAIAKLRIAPGAQVWMRDPVAEIVDNSVARVEAQVAPELLRFVQAGRAVDVKLMTIPPRRFREPIARIVPPGGAGGSSIVVNVPNPDRMLQPGTPAVITIQ